MNTKPTEPGPRRPHREDVGPTRTVLLRHTEADGRWHFDWMVERAGDEERRLVTFRVRDRIDLQTCQGFEAERIGDHRAAYLEYEGELSGGRGSVARVAAGEVRAFSESASVKVEANFGSGWRRYTGRPEAARLWIFEISAC